MIPAQAVITSSAVPASRWRLFGQSLLERNIRQLVQSGVNRIHLELNEADRLFFEQAVYKHVRSLSAEFISSGSPEPGGYISIQANHFILFRAFSDFENSFTSANGVFFPLKKADQYVIEESGDFIEARKLAIEVIRTGSGGAIAQNVNKRISIPVSLLLARLRVLPNVITVANFFLGALSIVLIAWGGHMQQAAGGILVQLCSIIDGCDGEVARMTTRFSRLGGLLDTLSDQMLAVALITVSLVKVYTNYSAGVFIFAMTGLLGGVAVMFAIIIFFMRRYSESMSMASFNREFIDILPETDYLAGAMRYLQYLTRKELYSMFVCLFCLFGAIQVYAVAFAVIVSVGVFLMLILAIRYFPGMERVER